MSDGADRHAAAFVGAFVEELVRSGMRHVCIAPGSRSTPLAMTLASHDAIRPWVHLDERAAAFFALGMARVLGEPEVGIDGGGGLREEGDGRGGARPAPVWGRREGERSWNVECGWSSRERVWPD